MELVKDLHGLVKLAGGRAATVGVLALALAATSCSAPEEQSSGDNQVKKILRQYKEVYLLRPGSGDTDKHLGYIGTGIQRLQDADVTVNMVYNTSWRQIGYYFDNGATFQQEGTDDTSIGSHPPSRSLELLYGVEGNFRFKDGL